MTTDPYDEPEIPDDSHLIRRIDPVHHLTFDQNLNCQRISSKAFRPSSGYNEGLSIDIKHLMDRAGINARQFVTTPKFTGSVKILASTVRSVGLRVGFDPIPDSNPYHGQIWGSQSPNKFSRAQERAIINSCEWFVKIEGIRIR